MANEVASTMIQLGWIPDSGDYNLVVIPNSITFDADGKPNEQTINAHVYRSNDDGQTPIAVNTSTSDFYLMIAVKIGGVAARPKKVSSINASMLLDASSARFDLVPVEKVRADWTYDDADVMKSQSISLVHNGSNGAVPAIAFTRSKTKPGRPSGGTYIKPVPDTAGWSDTAPSGSDPLWMSKATFTVDDTVPPTWSDPSPVADDVDIEFIFNGNETAAVPAATHPYPESTADGWGKNPVGAVWMGIAKKVGGAWGPWEVVRIKGETGANVVFAKATPEALEMKAPVKTYRVYVDVYDGGKRVPTGRFSIDPLTSGGSGSWLVPNVVKWSNNYSDRFCYALEWVDTTQDVNVTVNAKATYNGENYPFTIQIRSIRDGEDGKPGEDAYILDLDNEVQGIACDAEGVPVTNKEINAPLASSGIKVYKGGSDDTAEWSLSKKDISCVSKLAGQVSGLTGKKTYKLEVSSLATDSDTASVVVTAEKGTGSDKKILTATMSLYKVKPGESPSVYGIQVSDSAISRNANGSLSPQSIAATKTKTTGDLFENTKEKLLTYEFERPSGGTETVLANTTKEGGIVASIPSDCTAVILRLWDDDSKAKLLDRERVPIVKDGEDGDNAVNYKLVVNPTSLTYDLNTGAYVGGKNTIKCKIVKIDGESMTEVSLASLGSGFTLQHENYKNGVLSETRNYDGGINCMTTQFSQIDLVLKKNGVEIDRVSVGVNVTGKNGTTGKNGVWVPPPMLWLDYPTDPAYKFQAGNVDKGDERLDIVLVEEWETDKNNQQVRKLTPYKCVVTHTKDPDHHPASDNLKLTSKGYWQHCDAGVYKFLATDLLLANNARINFLSGQSIRVGEGSNMCGYFGSPVEGAILYTGGDNLGNATYVVYSNGEARWGNANGKRIEMNPANGSLSMFDEGGNLRFSLVGDFVDPANAIPDSISTQPTYTSIALTDSVLRQDPSRLDDVTGMCEPLVVEVLKDLVMDGSSGIATINVPKLNFYINCGENAHPVTGYVYARFCIDVKRNGTVMWHKEYTGTSAYNISKHIEINEEKITVAVSKDDEITVECVLEADMLDIGDGTYTMVGVYGFAPNNKVTASIEYQAMRSMIAQNGFVFSSSSKNYVYFLADKNGILQVGCKANGVTKF